MALPEDVGITWIRLCSVSDRPAIASSIYRSRNKQPVSCSRSFLETANASAMQFKQLLDPDRFLKRRMLLLPAFGNLTRPFVPTNSSQTAKRFFLNRSLIDPKCRIDAESPPTTPSADRADSVAIGSKPDTLKRAANLVCPRSSRLRCMFGWRGGVC